MAGLSSTGFSVKRLDEIIASLKASAVTKFSPSLGIDYFGQILGKNRNKSTVDTIIQSEILQEQEVLQLAEYSSVYDNALRKLNTSFKARTLDGFYAVVDLTI